MGNIKVNTSDFDIITDHLSEAGSQIDNVRATANYIQRVIDYRLHNSTYTSFRSIDILLTEAKAKNSKIIERSQLISRTYGQLEIDISNKKENLAKTAAKSKDKFEFKSILDGVNEIASGAQESLKKTNAKLTEFIGKENFEKIIEVNRKIKDAVNKVAATNATVVVSLVEGLLTFGEAVMDLAVILKMVSATPFVIVQDAASFAISKATGKEWHSVTDALWNGTKAIVSKKNVTFAFDSFYQKTEIGKFMAEKSFGFQNIRSIGSGIGYVAGVVALSLVTFGIGGVAVGGGTAASTAIGGLTVTGGQLAITAGAAGIGKGTEKAWNEGAGIGKGLFYGVLNGGWEGLQFYLGSKIGTATFTKGASLLGKLVNSSGRVILDATDGAVEGFVQPLLTMFYKGDASKSFAENYSSLFEQNGGLKTVATQAIIGGGSSLIGESFNIKKFFKKDSYVKKIKDQAPLQNLDKNGSKSKSPFHHNNEIFISAGKLDQFFAEYYRNSSPVYGASQQALSDLYYYDVDGCRYDASRFEGLVKEGRKPFGEIKKVGQSRYVEIKNKLTNKGFSNRDASAIISGVNSKGACSYAASANEIFSVYRNAPNKFAEVFGFPMYQRTSSGGTRLNDSELILDLYMFSNDKVNGGDLFDSRSRPPKIISFESEQRDIFGRNQLNASKQKYMSTSSGKNEVEIDKYLKSKNSNFRYVSEIVTNRASTNNKRLSEDAMIKMISGVNERMEAGQNITLGIYTSKNAEIRMIPKDNHSVSVTTNNWTEGGGHSVFVTDICTDGFMVSSWGGRFLIPFSDLQKGGRFIVNSSAIT